jgi:hypothetical protein
MHAHIKDLDISPKKVCKWLNKHMKRHSTPHEKTLNTTNHQGNAIKKTKYQFAPIKVVIIKNTENDKCW